MNGHVAWMRPVSVWIVSCLVSRWGAALVLLGTLVLAAVTAVSWTHNTPSPGAATRQTFPTSSRSSCVTSLLVLQDGALRNQDGPKCH